MLGQQGGGYPIVALVDNEPEKFDKHGRVPGGNRGGEFSLFIVTPEPEPTKFEQAVAKYRPQSDTKETIQRIASELLAIAKKEALKDLPRWEKSNLIDTANLSFKRIDGKTVICYHNRMIALADLKKLPGFKEE